MSRSRVTRPTQGASQGPGTRTQGGNSSTPTTWARSCRRCLWDEPEVGGFVRAPVAVVDRQSPQIWSECAGEQGRLQSLFLGDVSENPLTPFVDEDRLTGPLGLSEKVTGLEVEKFHSSFRVSHLSSFTQRLMYRRWSASDRQTHSFQVPHTEVGNHNDQSLDTPKKNSGSFKTG